MYKKTKVLYERADNVMGTFEDKCHGQEKKQIGYIGNNAFEPYQ
jgi:hypothetical protein